MTIADAICWTVVLIVAIQTCFALTFAAILFRNKPTLDTDYTPLAAIVLCLRGADPFLRQCITRLLDQDYPDYELHVVVDSHQDPSQQILREFESNPRLSVSVLEHPAETCSLKCSSLVQAIGELDPSFEIIALCDADCVPHRTWLAELVVPLACSEVGATTGNRWYDPPDAAGASLLRYLWNVPASVNMILLKIAWGGSLAIRRRVLLETGLLEKWSYALCEDTMLYRVLRRHGYRQVFVPSVMMVNRESCTLGDLMKWIPRQLLTAKLYHPSWPATVGYGILSFIVPLLAAGLAFVGWMRSDMASIRMALLVFAGFELSNVLLVALCQWSVCRQLSNEEAKPRWFGFRREAKEFLPYDGLPSPLKVTTDTDFRQTNGKLAAAVRVTSLLMLPIWIVFAQLLAPLSFLRCFLITNITWRGIDYRIRGRKIKRGKYVAFGEPMKQTNSL
ncbi:glycosyltransferase [Novipirellula artificiosorum]|uniref:glycosyltransferase n=1 Tax=Novipirellula artificiosorum TaxID=2528016 RepID=UPI001E33810A|nr:glycosyltransferase family 2 protein [Novipirellula artificiosorum]